MSGNVETSCIYMFMMLQRYANHMHIWYTVQRSLICRET